MSMELILFIIKCTNRHFPEQAKIRLTAGNSTKCIFLSTGDMADRNLLYLEPAFHFLAQLSGDRDGPAPDMYAIVREEADLI